MLSYATVGNKRGYAFIQPFLFGGRIADIKNVFVCLHVALVVDIDSVAPTQTLLCRRFERR